MHFIARTVIVLVALSCASCATQRDRAVVAANAAAKIADGAHELIARRYQAALEACVSLSTRAQAESCAIEVEGRYEPVWSGYEVARQAWLVLSATVQAIDVLSEPVSDLDLLAKMVQLGEAVVELQRVVGNLEVAP